MTRVVISMLCVLLLAVPLGVLEAEPAPRVQLDIDASGAVEFLEFMNYIRQRNAEYYAARVVSDSLAATRVREDQTCGDGRQGAGHGFGRGLGRDRS